MQNILRIKINLIIGIALLLSLTYAPETAQASWPPFDFKLVPSPEGNKITYRIEFETRVNGTMTNLTFKVPIPEGTRFVEASAQPSTEVSFDGNEVTFFTSSLFNLALYRKSRRFIIDDFFFTVEITDPEKKTFATHAWISWEGDQAGNYLTEDVYIDSTKQALNWKAPPAPWLQLEIGATVANEIITYSIYPKNAGRRMWDVKVNVPIPEGTTFLSAESPPSFVADFDGKEVFFSAIELERGANVGALTFKVETEKNITSPLVTHAWATWKNADRRVGSSIVFQEEFRTGDIITLPNASQGLVISDKVEDVPFSNYDLESVALQNEGAGLTVNLFTHQNPDPTEHIEYSFFIDGDCDSNTGRRLDRAFGMEYQIKHKNQSGIASVKSWDSEEKRWVNVGTIRVNTLPEQNRVAFWVPYEMLGDIKQICWVVRTDNRIDLYYPDPPFDQIPDDNNLKILQFEAIPTGDFVPADFVYNPANGPSRGKLVSTGDTWQYLPGWSEPPSNWANINFDDKDWFSGPTSIGYGRNRYATDLRGVTQLPSQVDNSTILVERTITQTGVVLAMPTVGSLDSVFMRYVFTVGDPDIVTQLALKVDYKGGYIAYLNGVEVARRGLGNATSPVSYDTLANNDDIDETNTTDISDYITHLTQGINVLAIQAHRAVEEPNFFVDPELAWETDPSKVLETSNNTGIVSTSSTLSSIEGKLAVPIDNGRVAYDIHVFSLPDGEEVVKIPNARQPNFRFDGQRMLLNREGGGIENVFEYNFADGTEQQVSDAPQDWHPFYDPWGNRVVYGNFELTVGQETDAQEAGIRKPFIFVQCGLLPPHQETELRCRNIATLGILVPAGHIGEMQGSNPVWTSNDMIAYKGCNTWVGGNQCGIYIVPSTSTKGFSDGFIPRRLTQDTSDIPTDTKGNLIAFMSAQDGNWEVYVMGLNGDGIKNLSNNSVSNDGLPTISPDGNWVAFVSDRDDSWAIWVVPTTGGQVQKLFALPTNNPWGDKDRTWTNERISWGP